MKRTSTKTSLLRIGLILGGLLPLPAHAQTAADVALKQTEVLEQNSQLQNLQDVLTVKTEPGSIYSSIPLGDGTTILGEPAFASAYVNDNGTFWVEMNANNQFVPTDDGSADSRVLLEYLLRKDSTLASPSLHVSGGLLRLTDFAGGQSPLQAHVDLYAEVYDPLHSSGPASTFSASATLHGRGGTIGSETFTYESNGFTIGAGDYLESGDFGTNITDAVLTIPAQVIPLDISGVCLGCDFYLTIIATGYARNPGGETGATAYLRDPVHFGDTTGLDLGGPILDFSGVTVLPYVRAPEPGTLALVSLVAVALGLRGVRARRRASTAT